MDASHDPVQVDDAENHSLCLPRELRTQNDIEPQMSLPLTLRLFFGLNGFTLSLETLGLMYVINSRVEMPIPYLATYGAIAFLPYSFKPIYGYLSQGRIPRFRLFAFILFCNGICVLCTCLIPKGGVFLACLAAFARGVTDSWAELCLGLTLIDHARAPSHSPECKYEALASRFQADAAFSRNVGSFASNLATFAMFAGRQLLWSSHTELSGFDANLLLITAGSLQVLGAIVAFWHRDEFSAPTSQGFQPILRDDETELEGSPPDESSALQEDEESRASYSSEETSGGEGGSGPKASWCGATFCRSRGNTTLVVFLQATILILAMKGPISESSSHMLWQVILVSFLLATAIVGVSSCFHQWWYKSHQVGLYLILKHAIPSDSMVLGSFLYSLFQSSPAELQVLSLVGSGVTAFSSWSYGQMLSRYHTGDRFLLVIAGTTLLASFASLGNIVIVNYSQSSQLVWIVLLLRTIMEFFDEWAFLPDVVLATTSLSHATPSPSEFVGLHSLSEERSSDPQDGKPKNVGVEYSTLVSCIDFGDQLGSLATGPLVALLGISRENNFERLDHLILVCFLFNILSLGLIALLRKL